MGGAYRTANTVSTTLSSVTTAIPAHHSNSSSHPAAEAGLWVVLYLPSQNQFASGTAAMLKRDIGPGGYESSYLFGVKLSHGIDDFGNNFFANLATPSILCLRRSNALI